MKKAYNYVSPEEMASDILNVAAINQIEIEDLSFAKYLDLGGRFRSKASWTKKGGFGKIKNALLPNTGKDLGDIYSLNSRSTYLSKLEKNAGFKQNYEEMVSEVIKGLKVKIKPQKVIKTPKSDKSERVQLVAMLNDMHFGMCVDPEENGDLNAYDFKQAGRRVALFIKEVAGYKPHKRKQVEKLHLVLNGDLVEGIIHSLESRGQHLLTHQMNGALHILTHTLTYLSKHFTKIDIHALAGNHDRMVHKNGGKRPTTEIYDSYANIVYYALSTVFKPNKNINFFIPKMPYGFIDLPNGRLMYLHGDGIWSKQLGNVGKSINVAAMSNAIREFNAGEIAKGRQPVKMVLMAHVHSYSHFITSDGVEVCVAPSVCGINGFAHILNINNNLIAQVVFESTPDYIFGDSRLIRLNNADNNKSLDQVIPEFKKELKA
jgi:hypothetical protein